jgi:hypothetical protein
MKPAAAVLLAAAGIARRQWLTKIGPVEVSTPVAGVEADNQQLEGELAQADEDIGKLRQELSVMETWHATRGVRHDFRRNSEDDRKRSGGHQDG